MWLYNISTTAAFPGASQQWVCMHQANLSMDLKGSFGKCSLQSIGLACGWICSTGFLYLITLCVHSLQMGFCLSHWISTESTAATGRFSGIATVKVSLSIFQQTFLWDHIYCFVVILKPGVNISLRWKCCFTFGVYPRFWSCNKSRIKRFTALLLSAGRSTTALGVNI